MAVRLAGVRKVYRTSKTAEPVEALKGIDLAILRGEHVAIMGASGSGKSTLMNILGCLDRPTEGACELGGKDIALMGDDELSRYRGRTIGFIFQAFNLIPQLTILQNAQVPLFYQGVSPQERHERARKALGLVGLESRLDHRPRELSGGQQQRAAIARALVTDPAILLADEPTGNLDSSTGQSILELFDELSRKGVTIIVVTHDPGVGLRCKRTVRLKDGLVESDTRREEAAAV